MTELTRIEPQAIEPRPAEQAVQNSPMNLLALAIKQGIPLGELVAMNEKWEAKQAKKAFDEAMAAFQTDCPTIYKTTPGGTTKSGTVAYKFASFEDILAQVKPLLQKHGFSFQLGTDVESKDGWVIARCKVTHAQGHCDTTEAKFPLGTKTDIMSQTQVYAAALTFASRRVFQNCFGIVCASEDMDGRLEKTRNEYGPSKTAARKTAALNLWKLLIPIRGTEKTWDKANEWLKSKRIIASDKFAPELTVEEFEEAIEKATIALEVG